MNVAELSAAVVTGVISLFGSSPRYTALAGLADFMSDSAKGELRSDDTCGVSLFYIQKTFQFYPPNCLSGRSCEAFCQKAHRMFFKKAHLSQSRVIVTNLVQAAGS